MEGRTSIVIAHRLTTVEKCDRIVVIGEGKVLEDGKMSDLKNQEGGYFAKIAGKMEKPNVFEFDLAFELVLRRSWNCLG